MATLPKRFLRNYTIYFSVWTVFALFFSTQTIAQKFITGEKTPISHYVVSWLVGCYIFALLTPLVIWLGKRFPFHKDSWLRRGLLHLLFSLVFSVAQITVEAATLPVQHTQCHHGAGAPAKGTGGGGDAVSSQRSPALCAGRCGSPRSNFAARTGVFATLPRD